MTRLNRLLPAGLLAGVAAVSAQGVDKPPDKPVPVLVAEVTRQPLADRVEALGTLKANESVIITANVTETISSFISRTASGSRRGSAGRDDQRRGACPAGGGEGPGRRGGASVPAGEVAGQPALGLESLLDERKRDLDTARAMLVALEARLADRIILAPFDGVLGLRHLSQGALVEPGDPIATLDDDRIMKLDFAVPSVHLTALVPGLQVEAQTSAHGDRLFTGVVRGIDSRIDPVTRTVQVRAILPNPEGTLKPGLLMQIDLLVNPRDALVIPEKALLHKGLDHFVMAVIAGKDGPSADRRQVQIGTRQPGWVEIRAGLQPGERIITDGNDKVRPAQSIRILSAVDGGAQDPRASKDSAP